MRILNGEHSIKLNGINHWVKIEGSECKTIPLVIIHGGPGGNHYTFERTVGPLIAKTRTIVYYEQRGCGRSLEPDSDDDYTLELLIEDFIELKKWLDVDKVDLLGYSFGGELALEFSCAFPEDINRIILSGPSLMHSGIQKMVQLTGFMSIASNDLYNKIRMLQNKGLSVDEIYDKVWELADSKTVDLLLFENQEAARKNRELWNESNLVNTGLMMKALQENPRKTPLLSDLKNVKQPTLLIIGAFDRNTGLPIAKIIHRELSNSNLELFEKSAHFPDLEESKKFVRVVKEFLES